MFLARSSTVTGLASGVTRSLFVRFFPPQRYYLVMVMGRLSQHWVSFGTDTK